MNTQREGIYVRAADGAWLAGDIYRPEAKPRALALMIHGSYPQDRDGNIDDSKKWLLPHPLPKRNLFKDIREHLLSKDIAVAVYDKRAAGESEGSFAGTDMINTATDVIAMQNYIRTHHEVPLVMIGQSEGTRTIPMAISLGASPDAIILQGPALGSFTEAIFRQKDLAAKPFLARNPGEMAEKFPFIMAFYQAFFKGDLVQKVKETKESLYELSWSNRSWLYNLDYIRQSDAQDIPEILRKTKVPTLMLVGEHDLNTPPGPVQELKDRFAKSTDCSHIEISIIEGLEHSFRRVDPGESFIDAMAKPIDPEFFTYLDRFFDKNYA